MIGEHTETFLARDLEEYLENDVSHTLDIYKYVRGEVIGGYELLQTDTADELCGVALFYPDNLYDINETEINL